MKTPASSGRQARADAGSQKRVALRVVGWSEWSRQVVRGVKHYALEHKDWRLFISTDAADRPRILQPGLEWDGIITGVLKNVAGYKRILAEGRTRVVSVTAGAPAALREVLPTVRVDDARVAEMIGRHFALGGYRRIGYPNWTGGRGEDARCAALRSFAEQNQLEFLVYVNPREMFNPMVMPRTYISWLKKVPKPIAIATWNMEQARKTVTACQELGLSIPQDVAIVAWDDDEIFAETQEPTISAAVLPAERVGYESARLLQQLMEGMAPPTRPVLIEPQGILRVRQSSDAASLQDREVYLAQQFIRENALGDLQIDDIAQRVNVSRRKLEQDFSRLTGKTLHDAIVDERLKHAKALLVDTDWTTDRIARECGLSSAKSLHRLFLQHQGMTPSDYRERMSPS